MQHDPDYPYCAAVPHTYWNFFVLWCPHRQTFHGFSSRYDEEGLESDPANHARVNFSLGPFDGPDELQRQVLELVARYRTEWNAVHRPR